MEALVERTGLAGEITVDSAGTAAYHAGERADSRSRQTARSRGFELESRARQFRAEDFGRFDYVVAMDASNYDNLVALAPSRAAGAKVSLLRAFDPATPNGADVPDPYYGGPRGFDDVFDICEAGCQALLTHICDQHQLAAS